MIIEDVRKQYAEQANMMLVRDLVIEAIRISENIEVTDEEIEEELKKEAEMYKMEVDKIKSAIGDYKKYYTDRVADEKTIDFIYASAKKVKEVKAKKEAAKKQTEKKDNKEEGEAKKAEPKKKAAPKKSTKKAEEDKTDKE